MKVPISLGTGGGSGSDECTATAADILESKTAIYNGSNDEAEYGSMKDYSGTTQSASASLDSSNNRVQMTIPNTGKYDTAARLYATFTNMASLLGITADKIANGESILGVTGTARVYDSQSNSASLSVGSSLETWVNEYGDSYRMYNLTYSALGLSSLDFTPTGLIVFTANRALWATSGGANFIGAYDDVGNRYGYYPAASNSQYSFTKSQLYVPIYVSNGSSVYYTFLGYD